MGTIPIEPTLQTSVFHPVGKLPAVVAYSVHSVQELLPWESFKKPISQGEQDKWLPVCIQDRRGTRSLGVGGRFGAWRAPCRECSSSCLRHATNLASPEGQAWHAVFSALGSKPAAQTQAVEAAERVVMSAGQAEHAESPVTILTVPTAHASHTDSALRK